MPSQQNSGLPNNTGKTGTFLNSETLLNSETFLSPEGAEFQQDLSPQSDLARTSILHLGNDLCRWQTEARHVRLQPLFAPIRLLAQRLLAAHRDWEVQEQMHLDYISLEVRSHPDAELILIECRWSEDVQLQGTGALELRLAEPPGFDIPACVLFFKGRRQASPSFDVPENAQLEVLGTRDYLKNPTNSIESFLLQVFGTAECEAPT